VSTRYVVLGFTQGMCSKPLIGRYKSAEDLRDVFRVDPRVAARASRRDLLYVFEECGPGDPGCLYLVTFDIALVRVRDPYKSRRLVRRPSHEYSEVREMLYARLCGSVDLSTYVCIDDYSGEVDRYLSGVCGSYRVAYYRVKPWRDEDRELVREALQETLEWLTARALALASRVSSVAPQGYGQVRKRALGFLEEVATTKELARRVEAKLRELGVELPVFQTVVDAERVVREALQRREEGRWSG